MLDRRLPLAALLGLALATMIGCQPHPEGISGPPQAWEDMSHEDKQVFMTTNVLPHMQASFAAHDPERYATVGCDTCHVTGAARGDYAMPDPGLPNLAHFQREHMKKHPEMVRFMWEKIEPEMHELLGGKKGYGKFNCRNCHPVVR